MSAQGRWRQRVRWLLAGMASGAGLAYLFEPEHGRSHRQVARERAGAAVRHSTRRVRRAARATGLQTLGRARGLLHRLHPPPPSEPLDDVGLAHKVESVLFRDRHVPKGKISINAEDGTVFLRGQVESSELIDDLTESVRRIAGVHDVVSLLHLPGTEAPHPDDRQQTAPADSAP